MKMPCEITVWNVLPMIRRELACTMVNENKISQSKVAKNLGLTEAAISQYMTKKRGSLKINELDFKEQIIESARIISQEGDDQTIVTEICKLCHLIREGPCWEGIENNDQRNKE